MSKNILLILLAVLTIGILGCKEEIVSKDSVNNLVDNLDEKFEWLDYRIALEQWNLYTTGKADSLEFYQDLLRYTISADSVSRILYQGEKLLADPEQYRKYQLINEAVRLALIEYQPDIARIRDSLTTIDINHKALFEGDLFSRSDLYNIYRTDNNPTRREAAYRAYNSIGNKLKDGLSDLFKLRTQFAKSKGFNNYMSYVFDIRKENLNSYTKLLDSLDRASLSAYQGLINNIKSKLNKTDLEIWDLGFAYKDVSNAIDRYFPVDDQMDIVKASLENIGFDIDKLPIYFDLESREGKSQFAYQFNIKIPTDLRVLGNLTPGLQSTRTLTHEIGHALHSANIMQDNATYRNMIDGIWAESMGQIMASLTYDKDWLMKYGNVPSNLADNYLRAKKEQDLIYLRQQILWLKFELAAYQNPQKDLNKLYWDLFEEIMQLPRHDDIASWASVIHFTTHPVYLQNYLYADIITAQTVRYLKANYGSMVDNISTRSFLVQNYYRFGAKFDWRTLLKRGIEEDLNPDYFLANLLGD